MPAFDPVIKNFSIPLWRNVFIIFDKCIDTRYKIQSGRVGSRWFDTEQDAVYLHQQQVDETTAAGKAMLGMCAVFAEFEWNNISDRIKAGVARAKAQGKQLGRPTSVTDATKQRIRDMAGKGIGKLKIARTLSVGVSTVQRVLAP